MCDRTPNIDSDLVDLGIAFAANPAVAERLLAILCQRVDESPAQPQRAAEASVVGHTSLIP